MSVSGEARGGFPSNNQPITMLLLLLMVTTTKIMKIMMKAVERAQVECEGLSNGRGQPSVRLPHSAQHTPRGAP